MNKLIFSLFAVFLLSICLCGQTASADSISIVKLVESTESSDVNMEEALKMFDRAEKKSKEINNKPLTAFVLKKRGDYLSYRNEFEKSILNYQTAAEIYSGLNMISNEAECYKEEAGSFLFINRFTESLQLFFKAKGLAERAGNNGLKARINNNIGSVYESLEDWDNALLYNKQALEYRIKTNDLKGMSSSYSNLGNVYYYQSQYKKANVYYHRSLKFAKEIKDTAKINSIESKMGSSFQELGELDSAIYYLERTNKFYSSHKDTKYFNWCLNTAVLANTWLKKDDLARTGQYLNNCRECIEDIGSYDFRRSVYGLLSDYNQKKGNYKDALTYKRLQMEMVDSLAIESKVFENQRIAIRYEFHQKAKEDSLQYQLNLSQQEIISASYKNKMYLAIIVGILVLAAAGFGIARMRAVQRMKRSAEIEGMRQNLAGDLHDDVGSTLSSIQIISNLMTEKTNDPKVIEAAQNISGLSNKVANGIREIVWELNPANDSLEAIISQLRKISSEILTPSEISFSFNVKINDPNKKISPELRKEMVMVFKEAINNARKYSNAEKVDISISEKKSLLKMKISDNGIGFDPESVQKGNGLSNMERRSKKMNSEFRLESSPDHGTTIHLRILLP
ncbi:MAG: sensor histidine kinase [Moheibacter sp.]